MDENSNQGRDALGIFGRRQWPVLVAIFAGAGILALPLLLISPAFSRLEKVVWTILTLIYTFLVFYALYLVVVWGLRSMGLV